MIDPKIALQLLPGFLIGFTVHEAAHAQSARLLGDDTAYRQGRISLNPLKHLSPMGTVALFFLGFGWGKPVEINLYNFKKPKYYYLLSSLAGPAANILLCAVSLGLMYVLAAANKGSNEQSVVLRVIDNVLLYSYLINAVLAILNLIPLPPLDGSKIWACIIPGVRPISSSKWNNLWFIVVAILIFTGAINKIINPVLDLLFVLVPR